MENFLEGYPVVVEFPVAWGEMDAFGHVNNVHFFRYFENARIAYASKVMLHEHRDQTGIGPILFSTSCRYRHPLTYPDTLSVGAKVVSMEEDRFTMKYLIVSHKLGKVAAEGEGVIVTFDYRENRKTAIPEVIRQRVLELEKDLKVL
jgi:acyl-CoA thioester hydrolase